MTTAGQAYSAPHQSILCSYRRFIAGRDCLLDVGQAGRLIQTNLGPLLLAFVILWRDGEFGSSVHLVQCQQHCIFIRGFVSSVDVRMELARNTATVNDFLDRMI